MNPLFLLLGLFGLTVGYGSNSSSTTTSTSTVPVVDDDPATVPDDPVEDDTPEVPASGSDDDPVEDDTPEVPASGSDDDPVEDPVDDDPVDDDPVEDDTPEVPSGDSGNVDSPQQGGDGSGGAATDPIAASASVEVMAGRVATLQAQGNDISSVKIVSGVEHGNITVNPDNTLALVMTKSDFTGTQSFTYEVTDSSGATSLYQTNLNVTPGVQAGGWGTGETHYMLETDEDDRVVVEHGENHIKFYVSGSNDAYSRADVAQREGLSEGEITNEWLANSEYGKSEELALDTEAGMATWHTINPRYSINSDWLLFERGYTYDGFGEELLGRYSGGESELHPKYVGAWGEGSPPQIDTKIYHYDVDNVVFQDLHFSKGLLVVENDNIIFDNIVATGDTKAVMHSSGITVRNSEFIDTVREAPQNGVSWDPYYDREAGMYMDTTEGTLWEGNFFDMNGWAEDYLDGDGMPPSQYSHNLYLDATLSDVTLRDTISMRSSSVGTQVRSGGFVEDNLFADNNAGLITLGGDYEGAGAVGQYSLLQGNVVTYAAYKEANLAGALSLGLEDKGLMTSFVDNIVAHIDDPAANEDWKVWDHGSFQPNDYYYDDTVVWNWSTINPEFYSLDQQNVEGLDPTVLDETTIQRFTQQLTGNPNATTADLAEYLRAQADGRLDDVVDADLINRFFQEGFGVATEIRDSAETLTFAPNDIGEGVRWDNRLNWDTNDLPGLYPTDNVDLNGNYVAFGANTEIDTLDFSDGTLNIYGGKLTANGGLEDDGLLNLEGTGQIWTNGSDGSALDIEVSESARFANTGDMSGANLTVNDGQAILATDGGEYDVSNGHVLTIAEAAEVGFDDDDGDLAILDIQDDGTVAFEASADGLGEIGEFRSGANGDSPNVQSGIDLGNGTLSLNLNGLSASDGASFQLMSADEIVGIFDEALVDGLNGQNARIVVDYTNDTVALELSSGNGSVSIDTVGDQADVSSGAEAIWNALTSDQGVTAETLSALPEDELEDDMLAA